MDINPLLERLGYGWIFFLTLLGNLGIPIPEETIFITAGSLAFENVISLFGAILFSILSVSLTNNMSYFVGVFFGKPLFRIFKKIKGIHHVIDLTNHLFKHHGEKTIFFSRFIWNIRNISPLVAGAIGMKWRKYVLYDFLAIVIHVPIFVLLGFFFSNTIDIIIGKLILAKIILFVMFLVFIGVLLSKKIYQKIDEKFFFKKI